MSINGINAHNENSKLYRRAKNQDYWNYKFIFRLEERDTIIRISWP